MNKELEKVKPIKYIILGVVLFLLRYIPFKKQGIFTLSLANGGKLCSNSLIGGVMPSCNWVVPLNYGVIIISLGLIIYGGYLKFKK